MGVIFLFQKAFVVFYAMLLSKIGEKSKLCLIYEQILLLFGLGAEIFLGEFLFGRDAGCVARRSRKSATLPVGRGLRTRRPPPMPPKRPETLYVSSCVNTPFRLKSNADLGARVVNRVSELVDAGAVQPERPLVLAVHPRRHHVSLQMFRRDVCAAELHDLL